MNDKYTASDRRVLMTKWIADAWVDISINNKDSIVCFLSKILGFILLTKATRFVHLRSAGFFFFFFFFYSHITPHSPSGMAGEPV